MNFDVSSSALSYNLQAISKVIASKNTVPILDCFLFYLEGEKRKLTIIASDMETRLETSITALNVEGGGYFAVSAKILLDFLKELPEQPLSFEIDDENLSTVVRYENGKYEFIGQRGDTYPQQKEMKSDATSFSISAPVLLNGISRTLFATADDELRPVMNGIYFDIHPDRLIFVASDGHKLVQISDLTTKVKQEASFVLPKKSANLLRALLPKETEDITIRFDENTACIRAEKFEMVCRLVEGRYPNYSSVIPKENPNEMTIDRLYLVNALKRVSVSSNPASGLVRLHLTEEDGLTISAQDIDFSTSAEETVDCQYFGDELNIGFKAPYLIEMLSNINAKEINLQLGDSTRAGVIVPTENEPDEELLALLMPMMLNS